MGSSLYPGLAADRNPKKKRKLELSLSFWHFFIIKMKQASTVEPGEKSIPPGDQPDYSVSFSSPDFEKQLVDIFVREVSR